MSIREWKPGDVALVTSWRGEQQPAFRVASTFTDPDRGPVVWCVLDGIDTRGLSDSEVESASPLVLIDPEGRDVNRLVIRLGTRFKGSMSLMRETLRDLHTNPPPDEPEGVGAVVEDAHSQEWVHFGNGCWIKSVPNAQMETRDWSRIAAVRVLSEGVTR